MQQPKAEKANLQAAAKSHRYIPLSATSNQMAFVHSCKTPAQSNSNTYSNPVSCASKVRKGIPVQTSTTLLHQKLYLYLFTLLAASHTPQNVLPGASCVQCLKIDKCKKGPGKRLHLRNRVKRRPAEGNMEPVDTVKRKAMTINTVGQPLC